MATGHTDPDTGFWVYGEDDLVESTDGSPSFSALLNRNSTVLIAGLKAADDADTALPALGAYTYNSDGTVHTTPDGKAYAYNADSTVHTVTKGGVTRTYTYNSDGTVAGIA